ncbi:hypothetical protein MKK50_17960 [Methylobacterium sp. J-043]|nr:hypothetical protein [Methylobacterium sp. J-043]
MPYVFEVPAGPEQDEITEHIRSGARRVRPQAEVSIHPGAMGLRRVVVRCDKPEDEKAIATLIKSMFVPHSATMKGGSTP